MLAFVAVKGTRLAIRADARKGQIAGRNQPLAFPFLDLCPAKRHHARADGGRIEARLKMESIYAVGQRGRPARSIAALGLALCLFGTALRAECVAEIEPNEQPDQAAVVASEGCSTGTISNGDQDILIFTTDEPAVWTIALKGAAGRETKVDLFRLSGDPPAPGGILAGLSAGSDPAEFLLPAGTWGLGVSAAGDGDWTWQLDRTARPISLGDGFGPLVVGALQVALVEPFAAQSLPLTVTPAMARRGLSLRLDSLPGTPLQVTLDGPGGQLLSRQAYLAGPMEISGIGLDPGDYVLTVTGQAGEALPVAIGMKAGKPRLPTREDEPNDLAASARLLLPGKPVQAEISAQDDKDLWRIDVTPELAGRLLTLTAKLPQNASAAARKQVASGMGGTSRALCLRDAAGTDLQCRTGADVTLADLVLPEGSYFAAVSGPAEPGLPYEIALRSGPMAAADSEAEPNDVAAQANPIAPGTMASGRFVGFEQDRLALDVTGPPQLWRIASHGAYQLRLEDPLGNEIVQRDQLAGTGEDLLIDDVLLTEGRHTIKVEGEGTSWSVEVVAKGPRPKGSESEPNEFPTIANLLRPGETRIGTIADGADRDTLRFSLSRAAKVDLRLKQMSGTTPITATFTTPSGDSQMTMEGPELVFPGDLQPGDYTIQLAAYTRFDEGTGWQVSLNWVPADLPSGSGIGLALAPATAALASHLPYLQRLPLDVVLTNDGAGAETLVLGVDAPRAGLALKTVEGAVPEVALEPGESRTLSLILEAPADLPRDPALPVTVLGRAKNGDLRTGGVLTLTVAPDAAPAQPYADVPAPPLLRGGFNLASAAYGGNVPGLSADPPASSDPEDETVQFPGVHCLPKRALLSAILGRGEAGCAGKSVLRVRTKSRKVTG